MFAMVAFGVGEICGGPILGYVIDKKGNRAATLTNIIMIIIHTVFVMLFLYYNEYNWLAYLMTFFWGVQDSANNTHTSEMLGYEFEDNA
jgi:predicted MFS family arabinose efflux permease